MAPAWREVTIRDLLTHTSGLVSGGPGARDAAKLAPKTPADTLASYVPKLASVPLDFQPGTEWAYSGQAGPDVLGRIVEIVSGQPYDEFLRQRIFEPLRMKDTFFYAPDDRQARLVTLYEKSPQGLRKSENQDGFSSRTFFAAGAGLVSTAEDYLQFAQMLLNGGKLNGHVLLSPKTVQLMASNGRHVQRKARAARARHGLRVPGGRGRGLGGLGTARFHGQLRLGWCVRYPGVDRSRRKDGLHHHDPDAGATRAARFRKRRDAGDYRVAARSTK
ncbi:MAG: beta-lactamase family protein [Acidobacteriia bacterium]|nr:beta-lactamase family protein [Terriglobia bacterium]